MPLAPLPDLGGMDLPPLSTRVIGDFPIRWAATRPSATALVFPAEGASWTYREFVDDSMRVAAGYQGVGLRPGDRLGIMLPNRSEYVLAWYGSLFSGMIDVAINHGLTHEMLAYQLNISEVRAVVCDAESYASLLDVIERVPTLEFVFPIEPVPKRTSRLDLVDFGRLSDESSPGSLLLSGPTDIASIRYTSGTTGPAKAVACTNSQKTIASYLFTYLMDYQPSDRLYTPFPLHHTLASMMGIVASFQIGACCIVDGRFSASRYWKQIGDYDATLAHVLNPMLPMLLSQQPDPAIDRGHHCRQLWTAFDNPEFEERFNVKVVPHYSMSEAAPVAFLPREGSAHPGSCGKVGNLFDVRVIDEDENPVPPGVRGEMLIRPNVPHTIMAGYLGNPVATASAWRGLWYHTGDEGYLDEDGCLFLVGRMGDQIRRRGVNIPAEHIEDVARGHDAVVDAAAIAVPAELGESEVKLVLVLGAEQPPPAESFATYLSERLPAEMVPRFIEWRNDLPRTTTHKISKAALRGEGRGGITESTIDLRGR